jgi:hypothetical protein
MTLDGFSRVAQQPSTAHFDETTAKHRGQPSFTEIEGEMTRQNRIYPASRCAAFGVGCCTG